MRPLLISMGEALVVGARSARATTTAPPRRSAPRPRGRSISPPPPLLEVAASPPAAAAALGAAGGRRAGRRVVEDARRGRIRVERIVHANLERRALLANVAAAEGVAGGRRQPPRRGGRRRQARPPRPPRARRRPRRRPRAAEERRRGRRKRRDVPRRRPRRGRPASSGAASRPAAAQRRRAARSRAAAAVADVRARRPVGRMAAERCTAPPSGAGPSASRRPLHDPAAAVADGRGPAGPPRPPSRPRAAAASISMFAAKPPRARGRCPARARLGAAGPAPWGCARSHVVQRRARASRHASRPPLPSRRSRQLRSPRDGCRARASRSRLSQVGRRPAPPRSSSPCRRRRARGAHDALVPAAAPICRVAAQLRDHRQGGRRLRRAATCSVCSLAGPETHLAQPAPLGRRRTAWAASLVAACFRGRLVRRVRIAARCARHVRAGGFQRARPRARLARARFRDGRAVVDDARALEGSPRSRSDREAGANLKAARARRSMRACASRSRRAWRASAPRTTSVGEKPPRRAEARSSGARAGRAFTKRRSSFLWVCRCSKRSCATSRERSGGAERARGGRGGQGRRGDATK